MCTCSSSSLPVGPAGPQGPTGATGAGYLTATYSLNVGEIKTLNSFPITIVAAPAAGLAIEVISGTAKLTWGSVAFDNGDLDLLTDTAATYQAASAGTFLNATADADTRFSMIPNSTGTQVLSAKALTLWSTADSSATGDSTIKVYITYRLITL